ncbi:putative translation initiation factor eIF-2B subu nit beta [Beauveria bassiana D1-5]|uniref:Translation initiation factor eIF2B subunit beta n=1 Tax=Beauveria bassiana D1-5 TaxID=1245745 RepID=A0A0A2VBR2_BEABA|nr:putative translation initiation factor eIF-2B subu nit beta [Beauveria bassiana D1-5]
MPSVSAGYAPDLDKLIKSLKGQPLDASVESLLSLLKRRQIKGSEPCAIATAHILLQVVARSKWQDVDALIDNVSQVGRRLVKAQPTELAIGNIVRRVLGLIRDEAAEERHDQEDETQSEASAPATRTDGFSSPKPRPQLTSTLSSAGLPKTLFHLLSASPDIDLASSDPGSPFHNSGTSTPTTWKGTYSQIHTLRSEVIDGIEEIMDEISQVDDQIAALADVQIRPGDFVLAYRPSTTVERFILRAAQKRKFTLFLAIEAPSKPTNEEPHASFRRKLIAAGIAVINIHNSGLTAYMPRVDKVILGAKAIVANGSVMATAGSAAIARAAKEHGTAVIVLSGVYKLSPANPFAEDTLIEWGDSSSFVNFANGTMVNHVEIRSALTEMVPSAFIDTYITNLGTHSRDYLSSIIADHYKHQDVNFDLVGERMV